MIDERQRRLVLRLALLAGGASAACLVAAALAASLIPPRFTTHRDAIGYALARRGIAYEAIYISHTWPETVNNVRFAANLDVRLPGDRRVAGMIACRTGRSECTYSLVSLGIEREPLPELVEQRSQPWLAWIERQTGRIGTWLAALLAL